MGPTCQREGAVRCLRWEADEWGLLGSEGEAARGGLVGLAGLARARVR